MNIFFYKKVSFFMEFVYNTSIIVVLSQEGCDCMFYKDNDVPESYSLKNIQFNLEGHLWKKELNN